MIENLARRLEEEGAALADNHDRIERFGIEFRALWNLIEEIFGRNIPLRLRLALDAFEAALETP